MLDRMNETLLSRRGFLRGLAGGVGSLSAAALLAGCGDSGSVADPAKAEGRGLYVSTFLGNTLENYNVSNGGRQRSISPGFTGSIEPPGAGAMGIAFGHNDDVWVACHFQDVIEHYDLKTGNLLKRVEGIHAPYGLAIGTDGYLYATDVVSIYGLSNAPDSIQRFDANTGQFLNVVAQINTPLGVVWGPDNNLYVSTARDGIVAHPNGTITLDTSHPASDTIVRVNPTTGAVTPLVTGTKLPFDFVFRNDGTLLVTEYLNNRIQVYNSTTGASLGTFASVPAPIGIAYGPDGYLYVTTNTDLLTSQNRGKVLRLDSTTGATVNAFISDLLGAAYVRFTSPVS